MQSLSPQERACPHWLPGVLVGLCAAQPLLDVLSFWTQDLAWGSKLTLSLRLLIFLGVMLTGFVLSERLALLLDRRCRVRRTLCGARAGVPARQRSIHDREPDLRRDQLHPLRAAAAVYDRFYHIPALLLKQGFASLERGITIAFWIIATVALLSALTGTNPYTYPDKRIGLCGWFYFANSQSAILSMLVPLALCPALRSGQIRRWLPIAVVGFAELFCFATRLAYMSLFVTAIGMVITLALTKRGSAKVCAVLLLCAAVCAAGYTVSPIHRNQQAVAANAVRKQENIDRLVAQGKAEFGDQGYAYLTYAYDEYLGGTVERYGLEATAEMYGYSTKAADITNVRTIKINYCRLMLNTEPLTSRLFGLSYDEMTYHGYCYDVENDFHGIAYLYGWAGLACLLAFLGYFLVIIVCALIRNARRYFTVEVCTCGVALCTALAHIYNTAGVLRRPNASFYLCLILASIWYLIYIRDYDDSKEN